MYNTYTGINPRVTTGEIRMKVTGKQIAIEWVAYAKRNKLKRNTIKYQNHQQAFITGVFACLAQDTPPIITIYGLCGRDLFDLTLDEVAV
jgi:hypothetical protein